MPDVYKDATMMPVTVLTLLVVGSQLHFCDVHDVCPVFNWASAALTRHDNTAAMCEHASPSLPCDTCKLMHNSSSCSS